jgi:hypothetical protein
MLTIRAEQMKALGEARQRQFEAQMLRYIRGAWTGQVEGMTDREILGLIRQGIAESERYGVVNGGDVARYIGYMVAYGADFDRTQPWAAEVLNSGEMNGTQKMDRIDDYELFAGRGGPS